MSNNTKKSAEKESLSIHHSYLIIVIVLFIFELLHNLLTFSSLEQIDPAKILLWSILGFIKIFLLAGILGMLTEISSGQEMIITAQNIFKNAKKYWKMLLLIKSVPFLIHLVIFFALAQSSYYVSALSINAHLNIVILYIAARWILSDKYVRHYKPQPVKTHLTLTGTATLLALYMFGIFFYHLPDWIDIHNMPLLRTLKLLTIYTQILQFIYFTQLVLKESPEIAKKFNPKKELFLINPTHGGSLIFRFTVLLTQRSYPPVFVILKALTPKDYHVREFNRKFWRKRFIQKGKLVAITCHTSNCYEAYKIAKDMKNAGSKVIMGGPHVTYLPEEALEFCDSVVIGEVEGLWIQIVKDYENSNLQKKYTGGNMSENYHQDVQKELLLSPPEVIKDFIEATRGCKFRCHFCTIPGLSGGKTRTKPVEEVVDLIKKIKKRVKFFTFIDNNIYNDPGYARELFKALKPLKINWASQCTIDIAQNDETLKLARESGCKSLCIGYEIYGDSNEKDAGGKFRMAEKYKKFTKRLKKAGIRIKANFIFGFDSDDYKKLWQMWKFCFSIQPEITIVYLNTPMPGSQQYAEMLKANRIINLNWRNYNCTNFVVNHKKLDSFVLSCLYFPIYVLFFTTTSRSGLGLLCFVISAVIIALKIV